MGPLDGMVKHREPSSAALPSRVRPARDPYSNLPDTDRQTDRYDLCAAQRILWPSILTFARYMDKKTGGPNLTTHG
jgi:hypothetical protein